MVVRSGVPVKKPGDICKKGDLLVSGELHIMNDSQEIVRKEYVHADADIYISRKISYYQEFPMKLSLIHIFLAMGAGKAGAKGIDEYLKNK